MWLRCTVPDEAVVALIRIDRREGSDWEDQAGSAGFWSAILPLQTAFDEREPPNVFRVRPAGVSLDRQREGIVCAVGRVECGERLRAQT